MKRLGQHPVLCYCLISLLSVQTVSTVTNSGSYIKQSSRNTSQTNVLAQLASDTDPDCMNHSECDTLPAQCLYEINGCNQTCNYGEETAIQVEVLPTVSCKGLSIHNRTMRCRFCYQTESHEHACIVKTHCSSSRAYSNSVYQTTCQVKPGVLCFGKRKFHKSMTCQWSNDYSWTTTMLLSITLGGFGVDRFYLGHWKEGLGKFFSFGGLGIWTIIDVVLIAIGYVTPQDGSVYTYRSNFSSNYYSTNLL